MEFDAEDFVRGVGNTIEDLGERIPPMGDHLDLSTLPEEMRGDVKEIVVGGAFGAFGAGGVIKMNVPVDYTTHDDVRDRLEEFVARQATKYGRNGIWEVSCLDEPGVTLRRETTLSLWYDKKKGEVDHLSGKATLREMKDSAEDKGMWRLVKDEH